MTVRGNLYVPKQVAAELVGSSAVPDACRVTAGEVATPDRAVRMFRWVEALPESAFVHTRAWVRSVVDHYHETGELLDSMADRRYPPIREAVVARASDTVRAVRKLVEGASAGATPVLQELDDALESSGKELAALHRKLAPFAQPTEPRGIDVMQLRVILKQHVELGHELRKTIRAEFDLT